MHSTEFLALARYADEMNFVITSFSTLLERSDDHPNAVYDLAFTNPDTNTRQSAVVTMTRRDVPNADPLSYANADRMYDIRVAWDGKRA